MVYVMLTPLPPPFHSPISVPQVNRSRAGLWRRTWQGSFQGVQLSSRQAPQGLEVPAQACQLAAIQLGGLLQAGPEQLAQLVQRLRAVQPRCRLHLLHGGQRAACLTRLQNGGCSGDDRIPQHVRPEHGWTGLGRMGPADAGPPGCPALLHQLPDLPAPPGRP